MQAMVRSYAWVAKHGIPTSVSQTIIALLEAASIARNTRKGAKQVAPANPLVAHL